MQYKPCLGQESICIQYVFNINFKDIIWKVIHILA